MSADLWMVYVLLSQNGGRMGRNYTKTAPRRCANTVTPRGLADCEGVD